MKHFSLKKSPGLAGLWKNGSTARLAAIVTLCLALAVAGSASAAPSDVVNNLGSADVNGEEFTFSGKLGAQAIQTGSQASTLNSVTVTLADYVGGSVASISLRADNSGDPGTVIETLGNVTFSGSNSQNLTRSSSSNPTLSANTKYWIVLAYVSGDFDWRVTSSSAGNGTGTMLPDDFASNFNGASWFTGTPENYLVAVSATEVVPPTLTLSPQLNVNGTEGQQVALTLRSFTVTRGGDTSGTVSVDYAVTGSGPNPADAADFNGTLPLGTVIFDPGETSATIDASNVGDRLVEADEGYTVTLSNPTGGASILVASQSGTIVNDDSATVSIVSNGNVTEGDSGTVTASFTVRIDVVTSVIPSYTPTIDRNLSITVNTVNGSATAGSDFIGLSSQMVTIPAGSNSVDVNVTVNGDHATEDEESFSVSISGLNAEGRNVTLGTSSASATILNDDTTGAPIVLVDNLGLNTGATGDFSSPRGRAQAFSTDGAGYVLDRISVLVGSLGGTANFTVELRDDNGGLPGSNVIESWAGNVNSGSLTPRTFTSGGGTLLAANTQYWIALVPSSAILFWGTADNDGHSGPGSVGAAAGANPPPGYSPLTGEFYLFQVAAGALNASTIDLASDLNTTGPEGNPVALTFRRFVATRSGDTSTMVTVDYAVTGAGANPTDAADFDGVFPSGTITFNPGVTSQNVFADNSGDRLVELDEGYAITLSNPSPGTTLNTTSLSGTIENDDSATVSIVSNGNVTEGDSGTTMASFTVRIDTVNLIPPFTPTIDRDLTVNVSTVNGTATGGDDFVSVVNQQVTIPAGMTSASFTVAVNGDDVLEADEMFSVSLSNPQASGRDVTIGAGGSAHTTILNDDQHDVLVDLDASNNLVIRQRNPTAANDLLLEIMIDSDSQTITVNCPTHSVGLGTATGTQNGLTSVEVAISSFSGSQIILNPENGNDQVSVYVPDASVGKSVVLNGGMGNDALNLGNMSGTTFSSVIHNFANANDGGVDVGGSVMISYTGLEPIDDPLIATEREFNFSGANDAITLTPLGPGFSMISTAGTSESITFDHPLLKLTIRGQGGDDSIHLDNIGSGHGGELILDGGADSDTIQFTGSAVSGPSGIAATAETINISSGSIAATMGLILDGNVRLLSATTLTSAQSTFHGTVDGSGGAFSLTVAGRAIFNNVVGAFSGITTLTVTDATTINQSSPGLITINTTGDQDYQGSFTLASGQDSILKATGASIRFRGVVNGAAGLTTKGNAQFQGTVGGVTALTSLKLDDGGFIGASLVRTTGSQIYEGSVFLAEPITFAGSFIGIHGAMDQNPVAAPLSVIVDGNLQLGNGFAGRLGEVAAPVNFTVRGTATFLPESNPGQHDARSSGVQTYDDAINLNGIVRLSGSTLRFQSGAQMNFDVNGATPGSGHDQLDLTGSVELNGNALAISSTMAPPAGSEIIIIQNDGTDAVSGTFSGLPQGAAIPGGIGGVSATISYIGGSGNDVTLNIPLPPTFSISAGQAPAMEGDSGGSVYNFTITRAGDTSATDTVDYTVVGSGAAPANSSDFQNSAFAVRRAVFTPGNTTLAITVTVNGDVEPEADEGFTVTLSNPSSGATLGTATATGVIFDDDVPSSMEIVNNIGGNQGAAEIIGNGQAHLQAFTTDSATYFLDTIFVLAADAFGTGSSFNLQLRDDDAGQPGEVLEQWTGPNLSTTDFGPFGFTSATGLTLAPDTQYWVTMAVTSGSVRWGSVANQNTAGPGTIGNLMIGNPIPFYSNVSGAFQIMTVSGSDISPPTLDIAPGTGASGMEIDTATRFIEFDVTRSGNANIGVSVDWAVTGTGGLNSDDFAGVTLPSGTLTFNPGDSSKPIQFSSTGDVLVELDEFYTVTLSNPSGGATLGTATAMGSILNDDSALVSIRQPTGVPEGDSGTVVVPVTIEIERTMFLPIRDVCIDADLMVSVSTVDGSSSAKLADNDYVQIDGQTVTIPAGSRSATFNLTINGDAKIEMDETIRLQISSPMASGRSVSIQTGTADATAQDDDTPAPVSLVTNFTQPLAEPQPDPLTGSTSDIQSFVTDDRTYTFNSLSVLVNAAFGSVSFSVELREDNGGAPGDVLETWSGSVSSGLLASKDFDSVGGVTLQPNTRYWIALIPQSGFLLWGAPASDANTGTGTVGKLVRGNPIPFYSDRSDDFRFIRVVATETAPLVIQGGAVTVTPGGDVTIQVTGPANATMVVEFSDDLKMWFPVGPVMTDGDGNATATDSGAGSQLHRFYRIGFTQASP